MAALRAGLPVIMYYAAARDSGFMRRAYPSVRRSVCLSPKCKNAIFSKTKQFRAMVYWRPIGSRTWAFQRTHYWTLQIQDGWDAPSWKSTGRHFFCRGGPIWIKMLLTGAEWHVDCGDMVEIETRCRILIWRTFGRIQWHIILEPPTTLQGVRSPSALLKIVFRHILFCFFLMQFGLWRAASFVSSPVHLFEIRDSALSQLYCLKCLDK